MGLHLAGVGRRQIVNAQVEDGSVHRHAPFHGEWHIGGIGCHSQHGWSLNGIVVGQRNHAVQLQHILNLVALYFMRAPWREGRCPICPGKIDWNDRLFVLPIEHALENRPLFSKSRDKLQLLFRELGVAVQRDASTKLPCAVWSFGKT